MLCSDQNGCWIEILWIIVIMLACTLYAYYVDSRRPEDDPKKKRYHPLAIVLAPITFPLLVLLSVIFFTLRVATYGVFMVLFTFALIFIRKPFFLEWLKKTAMTIGNLLLEANTLLIRFFLRPRAGSV